MGFLNCWRRIGGRTEEGERDSEGRESEEEEEQRVKMGGYGIRIIGDDIYDLIARNLVGIDKLSKHRIPGDPESNLHSRAGEWSFKHSNVCSAVARKGGTLS